MDWDSRVTCMGSRGGIDGGGVEGLGGEGWRLSLAVGGTWGLSSLWSYGCCLCHSRYDEGQCEEVTCDAGNYRLRLEQPEATCAAVWESY